MRQLIIKIGVIGACFISVKTTLAQQNPQFGFYMFNTLVINPAYAGSKDVLSATVLHRTQWASFDGAPTTQTVTVHSPLKIKNTGVGLSIVNDKIGSTQNTWINGDFSYALTLNDKGHKLAFGLKAGVDVYSANFSDRKIQDESDDVYLSSVSNEILPNVGFGLYYYGKKHYVGFSAPKLLNNKLGESTADQKSIQSRHYYLMGGYVFKINSVLDFKPSTQIKFDENTPLSVDLNVSFFIYKKLWLGTTYRVNEAVGFNSIFHINNYLKVGYMYELGITEISKYNNGSHEIMLGFDLNKKDSKDDSPRYF